MNAKTFTFLVVDGNRVSRKVYGRLLLKHFSEGCRIREGQTGAQALEACSQDAPDCMLVDYHLPDMDGLAFLDAVKARVKEPIPIVILTTEGDEQTAVEAMKLGAQDFLIKGRFSQPMLAQAVLNAIEKVELQKQLDQKRKDLESTNSRLLSTNKRLKETQQQLLDAAHKAGMAEIATGVLHNIGNILNSARTSVEVLENLQDKSKLRNLAKANQLLESFREVLSGQPKGDQLIAYYQNLETIRKDEKLKISNELEVLREKMDMIRNDVLEQSRYANSEFYVEEVEIHRVVEDAVNLHRADLEDAGIKIRKFFQETPLCPIVRVKLVHAVSNLIKNALDSMNHPDAGDQKILKVKVLAHDAEIEICVGDAGIGIPKDQLDSIFNYGFTTKTSHTGIGLHVAANAMTEMGGRIVAASDGPGKGAAFSLFLPLEPAKET